MRNGFILLCCVFWQATSAQNHDFNWTLGFANGQPIESEWGGMTIHFENGYPAIEKVNRQLNFGLNGGACSDSSGNLLFYTNGIALHNHQNVLIENGDTINPGLYWDDNDPTGYPNGVGPFSLPYPGHPNQYILFHTGFVIDTDSQYFRVSPLYFTIIDMAQNSGAGKVISKNNILLSGDLGWPAACKHGNGRDWWITVPIRRHPKQLTFLLSPEGISGPYEQMIGPAFNPNEDEFTSKSIFSPNGKIYLRHDGNSGPRIMDFDRCTGQFSNLRLLPYPPEIFSWSAAFSQDSRFLYLSKPSAIWSVDMLATNLSASFDTVGLFNYTYCPAYPNSTTVYSIQEAPNGKIYASVYAGNSRCMSVVERPMLPGLSAEANYGGLALPRWNHLTICHFPHYRLAEDTDSPCDTLSTPTPGDGFYTSTHRQSASSLTDNTTYIVLPAIWANFNEAAREEKHRLGNQLQTLWNDRRKTLQQQPFIKLKTTKQ